jgi:hypothetical protein
MAALSGSPVRKNQVVDRVTVLTSGDFSALAFRRPVVGVNDADDVREVDSAVEKQYSRLMPGKRPCRRLEYAQWPDLTNKSPDNPLFTD